MCNPSPGRILRNVKRMTKYNERKSTKIPNNKTVLSTAILEPINIHPIPCKILTTRRQTEISIEGKQKHLSYRTFQPIEVIPESSNDDDLLFTTYINGSSQTTTFICNFCYDDFTYKCSPTMRSHILTAHRTEMDNRLRTCYISLPRSETMFF